MRLLANFRPTYANVVATAALVIALGGTAYAATTIGTSDIQNGAVTTPKLADEAVSSAKVAPNSIGSAALVNKSVTLADLKGAHQAGTIGFALSAHSCGTLNIAASGMAAGQAAFLSWTTSLPPNILFGPVRVVSPTQVSVQACNQGSNSVNMSNVGIRLVTFG